MNTLKHPDSNVIFLFRMSAIGDIVIAVRTVQYFLQNDYIPIFVSSEKFKDILFKVKGLNHFICFDDTYKPYFYYNQECVEQSVFLEKLNQSYPNLNIQFCDLQNRIRSRRARLYIKNFILKQTDIKTYKLSINVWRRNFFILCAYLSRFQKNRSAAAKTINKIHDRQLRLINKIFKKDDKNIFKGHLLENNIFDYTEQQSINPYVCLFPGASGPLKEWPVAYYKELAILIVQRTNYDVYICGDKNDQKRFESVFQNISDKVKIRLGRDSLSKSFDIIAGASHIFTNDSFASHVADAYQKPATVIFGPTSPVFGFSPISSQVHVIYNNLNCSPCTRHGKGKCRFQNSYCLASIKPSDIFEDFLSRT